MPGPSKGFPPPPKPFRLTRPALSENDIEAACLDLLRARGYWIIRQHVGKFQTIAGRWITIGEAGLPDYAAVHRIYPGFLFEVKRPGKTPAPHQETKIFHIRMGYKLAVVAVDSAQALRLFLDDHEKRTKAQWHQHLNRPR